MTELQRIQLARRIAGMLLGSLVVSLGADCLAIAFVGDHYGIWLSWFLAPIAIVFIAFGVLIFSKAVSKKGFPE